MATSSTTHLGRNSRSPSVSYTEDAAAGAHSVRESRTRRHIFWISVLKTITDSAVQAPRQSAASPMLSGGTDSANTKVSRTDMRKAAQSSKANLRRLKKKKTTLRTAHTMTPVQSAEFAGGRTVIPSHRAVPVTSANRKRTPKGTSRRSRDRRTLRVRESGPGEWGIGRVMPRL